MAPAGRGNEAVSQRTPLNSGIKWLDKKGSTGKSVATADMQDFTARAQSLACCTCHKPMNRKWLAGGWVT